MATTGSAVFDPTPRRVAVTGATGYMGRMLVAKLVERGHEVRALIRPGTRHRVPAGAEVVELDLFNEDEVTLALHTCDVAVHLLGTAHPNPSKAQEFKRVDLASAQVCITAAHRAQIPHFVYVSVAQPAPVMKAYVSARAEAERALRGSGITATILRPWYVLGPGHRWPVLLAPLYACAELFPALRDGARRLGLVTLAQMTQALVGAIERPPDRGRVRIIEAPQIRAHGNRPSPTCRRESTCRSSGL